MELTGWLLAYKPFIAACSGAVSNTDICSHMLAPCQLHSASLLSILSSKVGSMRVCRGAAAADPGSCRGDSAGNR